MAKISEERIRLILDLISRFPDGASIEEILLGLNPPPPRRTLQYQLAALVKRGLLITVGKARAIRYLLPSNEQKPFAKTEIPISFTAMSIQLAVTRPIQERKHVTYNREFLDQYLPNISYYLPETVRKKLFELGRTDGNRPAGTYARQIYSRLLIDLSWNSSRLEGNTYSLLETERLLELGVAAVGKDARETQMILNHKAAIDFLIESAEKLKLDRYTLLNIHALLSDELIPDAACGALRSISVAIGGSVYLPLGIPQVIQECFEQIIDTADSIRDPFEQAFFLMVHLPYLQPFEDVNKRVSRLAANLVLIRENLCPLSFVDVSEQTYVNGLLGIYELNQIELLRDVFVWAYERSCARYSVTQKSLGEPDPFRVRYRPIRKETILTIVQQGLDKKAATLLIRQRANDLIPKEDRLKFIETLENELIGLHEGNIARYGLKPLEFSKWKDGWR